VYQFVCDRNLATYHAGKEDYLRPSEHIGLDWNTVKNLNLFILKKLST